VLKRIGGDTKLEEKAVLECDQAALEGSFLGYSGESIVVEEGCVVAYFVG
jgi:hypothetical protein